MFQHQRHPPDEEDIADDVELDDLDFDEFEPWLPPPYLDLH